MKPIQSCVFGCKDSSKTTYHPFPEVPLLRQLWVKTVNRPGFVPDAGSVVCSAHFPPFKNHLDPYWVPCLFPERGQRRPPAPPWPALLRELAALPALFRPRHTELDKRRYESSLAKLRAAAGPDAATLIRPALMWYDKQLSRAIIPYLLSRRRPLARCLPPHLRKFEKAFRRLPDLLETYFLASHWAAMAEVCDTVAAGHTADTPVRAVWELLRSLVRLKLRWLSAMGDRLSQVPPAAALTRVELRVADAVIARDTTALWAVVYGESLQKLVELVDTHDLEGAAPSRQGWVAAHMEYCNRYLFCPLALLQRRWHELKMETRRILLETPWAADEIHHYIRNRWPGVVSAPPAPWTEMVEAGLVYTLTEDELDQVESIPRSDYFQPKVTADEECHTTHGPDDANKPLTQNTLAQNPSTQNPPTQNPSTQNPPNQNPGVLYPPIHSASVLNLPIQIPSAQNPPTQNPHDLNPPTQNQFAQNSSLYPSTQNPLIQNAITQNPPNQSALNPPIQNPITQNPPTQNPPTQNPPTQKLFVKPLKDLLAVPPDTAMQALFPAVNLLNVNHNISPPKIYNSPVSEVTKELLTIDPKTVTKKLIFESDDEDDKQLVIDERRIDCAFDENTEMNDASESVNESTVDTFNPVITAVKSERLDSPIKHVQYSVSETGCISIKKETEDLEEDSTCNVIDEKLLMEVRVVVQRLKNYQKTISLRNRSVRKHSSADSGREMDHRMETSSSKSRSSEGSSSYSGEADHNMESSLPDYSSKGSSCSGRELEDQNMKTSLPISCASEESSSNFGREIKNHNMETSPNNIANKDSSSNSGQEHHNIETSRLNSSFSKNGSNISGHEIHHNVKTSPNSKYTSSSDHPMDHIMETSPPDKFAIKESPSKYGREIHHNLKTSPNSKYTSSSDHPMDHIMKISRLNSSSSKDGSNISGHEIHHNVKTSPNSKYTSSSDHPIDHIMETSPSDKCAIKESPSKSGREIDHNIKSSPPSNSSSKDGSSNAGRQIPLEAVCRPLSVVVERIPLHVMRRYRGCPFPGAASPPPRAWSPPRRVSLPQRGGPRARPVAHVAPQAPNGGYGEGWPPESHAGNDFNGFCCVSRHILHSSRHASGARPPPARPAPAACSLSARHASACARRCACCCAHLMRGELSPLVTIAGIVHELRRALDVMTGKRSDVADKNMFDEDNNIQDNPQLNLQKVERRGRKRKRNSKHKLGDAQIKGRPTNRKTYVRPKRQRREKNENEEKPEEPKEVDYNEWMRQRTAFKKYFTIDTVPKSKDAENYNLVVKANQKVINVVHENQRQNETDVAKLHGPQPNVNQKLDQETSDQCDTIYHTSLSEGGVNALNSDNKGQTKNNLPVIKIENSETREVVVEIDNKHNSLNDPVVEIKKSNTIVKPVIKLKKFNTISETKLAEGTKEADYNEWMRQRNELKKYFTIRSVHKPIDATKDERDWNKKHIIHAKPFKETQNKRVIAKPAQPRLTNAISIQKPVIENCCNICKHNSTQRKVPTKPTVNKPFQVDEEDEDGTTSLPNSNVVLYVLKDGKRKKLLRPLTSANVQLHSQMLEQHSMGKHPLNEGLRSLTRSEISSTDISPVTRTKIASREMQKIQPVKTLNKIPSTIITISNNDLASAVPDVERAAPPKRMEAELKLPAWFRNMVTPAAQGLPAPDTSSPKKIIAPPLEELYVNVPVKFLSTQSVVNVPVKVAPSAAVTPVKVPPAPSVTPVKLTRVLAVTADNMANGNTVAPVKTARALAVTTDKEANVNTVAPVKIARALAVTADKVANVNTMPPVKIARALAVTADKVANVNTVTPVKLARALAVTADKEANASTVTPVKIARALAITADKVANANNVTPVKSARAAAVRSNNIAGAPAVSPVKIAPVPAVTTVKVAPAPAVTTVKVAPAPATSVRVAPTTPTKPSIPKLYILPARPGPVPVIQTPVSSAPHQAPVHSNSILETLINQNGHVDCHSVLEHLSKLASESAVTVTKQPMTAVNRPAGGTGNGDDVIVID